MICSNCHAWGKGERSGARLGERVAPVLVAPVPVLPIAEEAGVKEE